MKSLVKSIMRGAVGAAAAFLCLSGSIAQAAGARAHVEIVDSTGETVLSKVITLDDNGFRCVKGDADSGEELLGHPVLDGLTGQSTEDLLGHPVLDGLLGHPVLDGRLGHPVLDGRLGHPVLDGRLGHPVLDGRLGHPVLDGATEEDASSSDTSDVRWAIISMGRLSSIIDLEDLEDASLAIDGRTSLVAEAALDLLDLGMTPDQIALRDVEAAVSHLGYSRHALKLVAAAAERAVDLYENGECVSDGSLAGDLCGALR